MKYLRPLILVLVILAAWEAVARSGIWSPILFPPLEKIWRELFAFVTSVEGAKQTWVSLYRFGLEEQLPIDFVMANWFTSTYPSSFFRSNLLAERLGAGSRVSLFNARLTRTGRSEFRVLDGRSAAEVAEALGALRDEERDRLAGAHRPTSDRAASRTRAVLGQPERTPILSISTTA